MILTKTNSILQENSINGSSLSSTALLQNHHWLPIEWHICFKLATLAYKALHTGQPPYLAELRRRYEPVRTLRSSSSLLFCSLFHDAILSLARAPFESLRQLGTHSLPIFVILHHSLLFVGISKKTLFSVSLPYPLKTTLSASWFFRDYGALQIHYLLT